MLELTGLGALSLVVPGAARAISSRAERRLRFYNTHTGESLAQVYYAQGAYRPGVLGEIDHLLRDHRTDEVKAIDPRLLDLLHALGTSLDTREPFHVISGYRSPETNEMLRARGAAVGRRSLHLYGMAIDVSLPDRRVGEVRAAAIALRGGGVGAYPRSGFVHVDVGRVRTW